MNNRSPHTRHSLRALVRTEFISLSPDQSVAAALDLIRSGSQDSQVIYFYIVEPDGALAGVVSTRALLTAPLEASLGSIMDPRVRFVPLEADIEDVLTDFMVHKFLALPVVDREGRMVGVIDAGMFADNISEVLSRDTADEVFETIGFHLSQIKGASPFKAFRFRFPWLLATLASGISCALMASRFENVLTASIILSFFMTLVLGLGESVSMQSMTVTIQALRAQRPTLQWFGREFGKELATAALLGLASGIVVGAVVLLWKGQLPPALVIGGAMVITLTVASLTGLIIPAVLHALRLDPKVAAGPLTLGIADLFTIFIYLRLAAAVL